MMFWKRQSYGDREQSSGYWAAGGLGYQGAGGQLGGVMDLLFILIRVAVIQLSPLVKTHKNV